MSARRRGRWCSLMRVGNPDIAIDFDVPENPVVARFDRRLISQALTNIIKNATEACWRRFRPKSGASRRASRSPSMPTSGR